MKEGIRMFDYLPPYQDPADASPDVADALYNFFKRVRFYSERHNANWTNRYCLLLEVCDQLEHILTQDEPLCDSSLAEPPEDFQTLFQLLTYTICDEDFLFDEVGLQMSPRWSEIFGSKEKPFDTLEPNETFPVFTLTGCKSRAAAINSWKITHENCQAFGFSMIDLRNAYLTILDIRRKLKEHKTQEQNFPTESSSCAEPILQKQLFAAITMFCKKYGIPSDRIPCEKVKNIYRIAQENYVIRQLGPLFCFFAIRSNHNIYTADEFYVDLKHNDSIFVRKNPKREFQSSYEAYQEFALATEIWNTTVSLMTTFGTLPDVTVQYQLNPHRLLAAIQYQLQLNLPNEEVIEAANMCDKAWQTPSFKSELQQYNCKSCPDAIVLGEILNAFITIFRAQTRSLSNDPAIHKARDLKQALHIIYQYGLVNPKFVQDEYSTVELPADIINNASAQADYNFSDQQYDAIQQAILHQYGYEYDLNRLAFWLITLHTPFNHSLTEFESMRKEFYLQKTVFYICANLIHESFERFREYFGMQDAPLAVYNSDLRKDILKLRTIIAQKLDLSMLHAFFTDFYRFSEFAETSHGIGGYSFESSTTGSTGRRNAILAEYVFQFCSKQQKINSLSLKSFHYADHVLKQAVLTEFIGSAEQLVCERIFQILQLVLLKLYPL